MRIEYAPALLEAVVLAHVRRLEAAGDPVPARELQRDTHDLYLLDEAARERGFVKLHGEAFRKHGFEEPLREALGERPELAGLVARVQLFVAPEARLEEVDLNPPGSTERILRIRVGAWRFAQPKILREYLARQLVHVADLLDPAFGYEHLARLSDRPAEDGLLRDRYRVLWELSVAGRLARAGRCPDAERARVTGELDALYGTASTTARARIFARFFDGPRPTHADLLACAHDTRRLFALAGVPHERAGPMPGSPCPLCRFPSHSWSARLDDAVVAAVRSDFPSWSPATPICERCSDLYELAYATRSPS